MAGVRIHAIVCAVAGLLWLGAPSAHALGISIPTGTASLSALSPGSTATASGVSVLVTGVLAPWSLTIAPEASATPGRLRSTGTGCAGSPAALASALHVNTTKGLVTTTVDRPSYDIVSGTAQLAHGVAADTLTLSYSQPVSASEALVAGCSYAITLVFTAS